MKAGRTPSRDYFSALDQLRHNLESTRAARPKPLQAIVVYGGEEAQKRSMGELLSWSGLDAFSWADN